MEKDKARIFYFTLKDEQTKDEKLDWFANTKIEHIPFERITPDKKANWVNQTDNDFDDLLPLVDKGVKAGKSEEAIFQLFSRGVATQRDEWVYDFSPEVLIDKVKYLVDGYMEQLIKGTTREFDIKWDAETTQYIKRKISKKFENSQIIKSVYRPYIKQYLYLDKHFNGRTYQWFNIFRNTEINKFISISGIGSSKTFQILISQEVVCLDFLEKTQCLPLYRYDEKGDRIDNITDWGLTQFQTHYKDPKITKENIFHYTYAVLHHPAYCTKYELNLKREFPRLPFYPDFHQWTTWGKTLMDLHLNYETNLTT